MTESTRDGTYLKLPVKRYAPKTIRETAEGRYWRAYKSTGLVNQVSQVTSVHFADAYPHQLAVTSSARVSIFSSQSRRSTRTFSRFKDVAYSGVLRGDGKALAVGGQQGWVQLFDMSSRSVLRKFTTHTRAVRAVRFSPHDHATLCSGSDDATVRLWDVAAGACARRHDGHADYVRSVAGHPSSADVWASGSYDHTVKLWDARDASRAAGMTLDHGAPVEDIAWLPTGSLLVSVGGQDVCVWDVLGGGRLLRRLRCHQKTVMCCHVAPDGGPPPVFDDDVYADAFAHRGAMSRVAPRLLTGSLDGHVKVHELDGFTVTHSAKYPGPVLSVALSPDANLLAVGTANKLLSLRKRNKPRASHADAVGGGEGRAKTASGGHKVGGGGGDRRRRPRRLDAGSYQYFIRGTDAKAAEGDARILRRRRARLAAHDHALRRFRYGEALDAALAGGRAEVVAAVLEEIGVRGGLRAALSGRDAAALAPVLKFAAKHVANPRHTRQLAGVVSRVIDIYGGEVGASPVVDAALRSVRERVARQLKVQDELARLGGVAAPLLAAGQRAAFAAAGGA